MSDWINDILRKYKEGDNLEELKADMLRQIKNTIGECKKNGMNEDATLEYLATIWSYMTVIFSSLSIRAVGEAFK